jgi:hypothetical protein
MDQETSPIIQGSYVNADSAFDTKEARKVCFNHKLLPNISENKRNRKRTKPGPKRMFNQDVYACIPNFILAQFVLSVFLQCVGVDPRRAGTMVLRSTPNKDVSPS